MTRRVWPLVAIAGCYAPHALPGSPCSPTLTNCPEGQTCALVAGSYVCTAGAGADAAADSPILDAPRDTFVGPDAPVDAPPGTPWTLVQTAQVENGTTVTIAPSGAGHLIIVGVETLDPIAAVQDDAASSYVEVPMGRGTAASAGLGIDLWYAKNTSAGATTIVVATSSANAVVVWEVAGIRTTAPLDAASSRSDQAATTLPVGAPITTSAAGDFVVSVAIVANVVSGIHAGNEFTNDRTAKGNGWAHLTSASAPAGVHQAKWDQPTPGVYCAASAAFFTGP